MIRPLAPYSTAFTLALLLAAGSALAQASAPTAPPDRGSLERRVQSVGTLIETSSAAQQIESSGVASARERRDNARLMHREAWGLIGKGDLAAASKMLDQASREMMEGVRLAKPEQVNGEKARRDFDSRLDSARALLGAQQRITQEKGAGSEAQDAARRIEADMLQAQKLAAQNQLGDARILLDKAYLTARVSIESLRRGDTLVRSLNFATKKDEFEYEIDRNDTHRMLINVLLADRKDAKGAMPPMMRPFIDKAEGLRKDAEAAAKAGDHAAAIKTLEDSTRELVRAIRAGGIYIPG